MDRSYLANTSATPPTPPANASDYPTAGSKISGVPATIPGPWWFHQVTEELRNVVTGFGLTPSVSATNQVYLAILSAMHPVGSVYMSTSSTNPSSLFGGTWTAIKDRMLIGAGGDYSALATGGAKSVTLTASNLPSHTHTASSSSAGGHTHTGSADSAGAHSHTASSAGAHAHTISSDGAHTHSTTSAGSHTHTRGTMEIVGTFGADDRMFNYGAVSGAFSKGASKNVGSEGSDSGYIMEFNASSAWTGSTSSAGSHSHTAQSAGAHSHTAASNGAHTHTTTSAGAHSHSLTIASASGHTHTITVGSTGSGTSFSTMPPYFAVYMWYRTA